VERVAVRLVGELDVRRYGPDSASAPATGLGSRKARRLFAFLAASRGQLVPTDRIVDVLWPDGPPRRPAQDVATLVSRLRAALGPGVIVGGREGYRLGGPPDVRVDMDEAARCDRVALMLRNRPEFHVADVACVLVGATPISIYNSSSPDQIAYLRIR